jgi:GNAT superfamily N-acetyltransferase
LEGTIHRDGYLSGIYHADNPYDRGVGNFFLNIAPTGDLGGLWSGYDPENGKIHSGSYRFRKRIPVIVSKIEKNTAGQAMSIAEQQLGDSYIHENDFLDPDAISLCAVHGKNIIGFCIGKILKKDLFTSLYPAVSASLSRHFTYIDRLGLVASVATDPAYGGRGIASTLLRACLDEMDSAGLPLACAIGWKSGESVHVGGILERFSFRPVQEFQDFWKEDSLAKGYRCPVCGEPPCLCSAVVYIRHAPT